MLVFVAIARECASGHGAAARAFDYDARAVGGAPRAIHDGGTAIVNGLAPLIARQFFRLVHHLALGAAATRQSRRPRARDLDARPSAELLVIRSSGLK